jgi:spermidine synthase
MVDLEQWRRWHRASVLERLSPIQAQPDGLLLLEPAGSHMIAVTKTDSYLRLSLVNRGDFQSSVIQSELDLTDPFRLVSPYTQAMVAGLAWVSNLQSIHVMGFGAGSIPSFLRHYFPLAHIECTELDPNVVEVAQNFFGVQFDEQLRITLQDGREYLETHPQSYDALLINVALGDGSSPFLLTTQEFYHLCRAHLNPNGILIVNFVLGSPLYSEKVMTLHHVFECIYTCTLDHENTVVFAPLGHLSLEQIQQQALNWETTWNLPFSLSTHLQVLQKYTPRSSQILKDADLGLYCSEIRDL